MAAAYTALVSLMNTINLIENHSRHSFSFTQNQIGSLLDYAQFFLEFIESYSSHRRSKEVEDLETEIASAAHLAEDFLESHVVEQILAGSTLVDRGQKSSGFLHDLQTRMKGMKEKDMKVPEKVRSKVDENYRRTKMADDYYYSNEGSPSYSMYLERILERSIYPIAGKVRKMEEESRVKDDEQPTDFIAAAASSSSRPLGNTAVLGFDDYSIQLMGVLTSQQSTRLIISVVGMGGLGKTSLAKYVYDNLLIVQHFDIRAWATVSQVDDVEQILLELLSRKKESNKDTVAELGEQLHKKLSCRRYLIILDDMWSCKVWDRIRFYFPDNGNGSRIVVTTRLSDVASYFTSSSLVMDLLDEDTSWKLFCAKTFGEEEDCHVDLVGIGKNIVQQCKGLPLSIVVIAGHLRKSSRTWRQWADVARNMTSFLDSGEDLCLSILSLSYSHLPLYLKPCFLYMGIFPEDKEIRISTLIRFWVAEGFLRSDVGHGLEEIAEGYLKDLLDRNLISVGKKARNGIILTCNIHDLLREVCLKVGKEEKFFCVLKHPVSAKRRCHTTCPIYQCYNRSFAQPHSSTFWRILPEAREELDGVLNVDDELYPARRLRTMFEHFNMRYIFVYLQWSSTAYLQFDQQRAFSQLRTLIPYTHLPSSISLHWNLQTLVIMGMNEKILAPVEIWEMPQLRHVDIYDVVRLPDPLPVRDDAFVMRNLQTLLTVENFKLGEEVCRRIPNIKELQISYNPEASSSLEYCQHNLGLFHKLESLRCDFDQESNWRVFALNLTFPVSLKELWLASSGLHWEDLSMIGSLPCLEVLTLSYANSIKGNEWNPVEGEFLRLKSLVIYNCDDLVCWNAEKSHFPVLENLKLGYAHKLAEFPSDIGEIPTLHRIYLDRCSVAAVISVVRIAVEQEELENEDLRFKIQCKDEEELESVREMMEEEGLESNNLRLKCYSVR